MKSNREWLSGMFAVGVLAFAFAGASFAQTTTTVDTRNFEVISVDGNKLVFRDQNGTNEITVPDDFRFTVDGKKMAVGELKPGMKGTAAVTTTTTITPVVVTEVREAEVLKASDISTTVRMADGTTRKFTQGEINKRGIDVIKDGKRVVLADLKKGDKLSALIITAGPPAVLTEQEVTAVLAEPAADAVAAAKMAAATPPAMAPAPASAAPAAAPAAMAPAAAAAGGISGMMWLLIAIVVAALLFFFLRRKKQA